MGFAGSGGDCPPVGPLCGGRSGRRVGQERQVNVGDHDQGDVPVPGDVLTDLVMVEPGLVLGGLEALLDAPAGSCHADQGGQSGRAGGPAPVVGHFRGVADRAAGQQPVMGAVLAERDPGPVVETVPLGALAAGVALPS